jgi:hypothetical protein
MFPPPPPPPHYSREVSVFSFVFLFVYVWVVGNTALLRGMVLMSLMGMLYAAWKHILPPIYHHTQQRRESLEEKIVVLRVLSRIGKQNGRDGPVSDGSAGKPAGLVLCRMDRHPSVNPVRARTLYCMPFRLQSGGCRLDQRLSWPAGLAAELFGLWICAANFLTK